MDHNSTQSEMPPLVKLVLGCSASEISDLCGVHVQSVRKVVDPDRCLHTHHHTVVKVRRAIERWSFERGVNDLSTVWAWYDQLSMKVEEAA